MILKEEQRMQFTSTKSGRWRRLVSQTEADRQEHMQRQNRWTQLDRQKDRQTKRQVDGQYKDRQVETETERQMDRWLDRQIETEKQIDR